jgi:hypothetical protein
MVDSGIKKSKILENDLPPQNIDIQGYSVRYRIISEDQNRTSHWSPIFTLQPNYSFVSENITFHKTSSSANIIWDSVKIYKDTQFIKNASYYNVWIRWDKNDGGDWLLKDGTSSNNVSFVIPSTYTINGVDQAAAPNKMTVEIYLNSNPVSRDATYLRVYQLGPETV